MLVEMDGFDGNEGVIVTQPRIDPMLTMHYWLSHLIGKLLWALMYVEESKFRHMRKVPLADDVKAVLLLGERSFSGGLANLVNEAAFFLHVIIVV